MNNEVSTSEKAPPAQCQAVQHGAALRGTRAAALAPAEATRNESLTHAEGHGGRGFSVQLEGKRTGPTRPFPMSLY